MFKCKYYNSNHTWLILMNPAVNIYTVNIFNDIFPPFFLRSLDLYAVLEVLMFVSAAYVYIPTELKH